MSTITPRARRGFTIIEVVLVLAIAGLIFLMVFVALPTLNKMQRDTQRKNDAALIAAAVQEYRSNNHGKAPPDSGDDESLNIEYDEDDERSGIGTTWTNGLDSPSLRRYLGELDPDNVTTVVSVSNLVEKHIDSMYYTIGDEDVRGYVTVVIGTTCADMTTDKNYIQLDVTGKTGDVIVLRYLEIGEWYCLQV